MVGKEAELNNDDKITEPEKYLKLVVLKTSLDMTDGFTSISYMVLGKGSGSVGSQGVVVSI